MITPKYSRQNIEEFAEMVREDLGLTPPVTADDIRKAYDKLGIRLTPRKNCNLDSNINRLAPFEYEVFYNPDWDDRRFVWNMSASLGHILLCGLHKDRVKNIFTGDYECLTPEGYPEDISKVIHNVTQFEDSIKRCEDVFDLRETIHVNMDKKEYISYHVQCMYDFYSDALIRVQIQGGGYYYEYYIRFPKVQKENKCIN